MFRVPTPQWYGSPGSTPFPSICKLLAAFPRSSLVFARSLQHVWLPASHLLGECYLLDYLRSTHTPSNSHMYMCYVSNYFLFTKIIYIYTYMYVYVYTYVCIYICISFYIYTYLYIYIFMHIHMYIYTYIHTYTYIYMYVCIYIYTFILYVNMCTYIYIYICIIYIYSFLELHT